MDKNAIVGLLLALSLATSAYADGGCQVTLYSYWGSILPWPTEVFADKSSWDGKGSPPVTPGDALELANKELLRFPDAEYAELKSISLVPCRPITKEDWYYEVSFRDRRLTEGMSAGMSSLRFGILMNRIIAIPKKVHRSEAITNEGSGQKKNGCTEESGKLVCRSL